MMAISCTSNPFWGDERTDGLSITGNVILEYGETATPVFVWMDVLNQHTTTSENGDFEFSNLSTQLLDANVNGPANIYFFVHNYKLDFATIYFTDGLFSDNQADFSRDGELMDPIVLKKLFSGSMNVQSSDTVLDTFLVNFSIQTHRPTVLRAYKFIYSPFGMDFHSGLFFTKLDDENEEIIPYRFTTLDMHGNDAYDHVLYFSYDRDENHTWQFDVLLSDLNLESGQYIVTPYLQVIHDYIPNGLIHALGGDTVFTFSPEYLSLPSDLTLDTLIIDQ